MDTMVFSSNVLISGIYKSTIVYHGYITVFRGESGMMPFISPHLQTRCEEQRSSWWLQLNACLLFLCDTQIKPVKWCWSFNLVRMRSHPLQPYCWTTTHASQRQNNDRIVFTKTTVSGFTQRNYMTHLIVFRSHDLLPRSYARMSPQSMLKPPGGFSRPGRGPPWFRRGSEGWW